MSESDSLQKEEPKTKMVPEHVFAFRCHPGISCFTQCCRDVTIALTPYDVLRLRKALGISSYEFLEKYTLIIPKKNRLIPLVVLKMNDEDKKCPFVIEEGCRVYQERPWARTPLFLGTHLTRVRDSCREKTTTGTGRVGGSGG